MKKSPVATKSEKKNKPIATSVGGGSRPGKSSKYPIPTSAHEDVQGLGRKTSKALK